jgi:hypothetical protein
VPARLPPGYGVVATANDALRVVQYSGRRSGEAARVAASAPTRKLLAPGARASTLGSVYDVLATGGPPVVPAYDPLSGTGAAPAPGAAARYATVL